MTHLSDLRLSKSLKYTALYTAMRFFETKQDIFEKTYDNNTQILINSQNQKVFINGTEAFELTTKQSFVKLEFINRMLEYGFKLSDFDFDGELKAAFNGSDYYFLDWEDSIFHASKVTSELKGSCFYKSRLVSGIIEHKTLNANSDFLIREKKLISYYGKSKTVSVPFGVEEIESSAFWDNQLIEQVILPPGLINMGGDTFYNCKNLKKVNIPASVKVMGNNPFAGCPELTLENKSPFFSLENGVLYTADKKQLIYCSIQGNQSEVHIPEGVQIIGKHAFYLCDRLTKITLPESLKKMENNPFSGCSKLEIINNSAAYFIKDDVIYNGFKTCVIGTLNRIKTKRLELLEGIKSINRNSFWSCKGIETIVLPESLEDIGYNPFVGCSNLHFESKSPLFTVKDGILFNKDCSKIICYPEWKASGFVDVPDTVITLERGAFSGCSNMTGINLRNVNFISKSCFTNCNGLKELYLSDFVYYVGEWAFGHCSNLQSISAYIDLYIDNNALLNCPAKITYRQERANYLIESDNLYTLKAMQKTYLGKVDSILIDPPYNSKIDYIGYKDGNYKEGYLNFMSQRLELSYSLLSQIGFLVINIDEGEVGELEELCKQIFGKELVQVYKWKKLNPFFDKNRVSKPGKKLVEYEYIIVCRKSQFAELNKIMQPYFADGKLTEQKSDFPEVFDNFGTTSSAKDEMMTLFGDRDYFSTPKPLKLIKELIRATTNKHSIIMDYFAGSGTTGHACLELNKEDNGQRKFLLICNNESNICKNVTNKRLQLVIDKYDDDYVFI